MKNCAICECINLEEVFTIKKFPVFMGASSATEEKIMYEDLSYSVCNNCLTLQMSNLVPLDILYQENHNLETVGEIWKGHNEKFSDFIEFEKPEFVLEIGSPNSKLYKNFENKFFLKKWYCLEPNPVNNNLDENKFKLINGWLDENFTLPENNIERVDCIIMSHVFEHLHNPIKILKTIYDILDDNGKIIISIPNMEHISKNLLMPPSGIHFEHTFFIGVDNLKYLFENCGFIVKNIDYYDNHSVFITAIKTGFNLTDNIEKIKKGNKDNNLFFLKTIEKYNSLISKINDEILNISDEIYLYGSHFPAQFLYFNGIKKEKITACLDQSKYKIGKKLYGTNLQVFSPTILKNKGRVYVICHMGPYTNEIKETILKINKETIFL